MTVCEIFSLLELFVNFKSTIFQLIDFRAKNFGQYIFVNGLGISRIYKMKRNVVKNIRILKSSLQFSENGR